MKILITYLTGIGNTIMYIPALRTLHQQLPDAIVDVVVRHQASKEILERFNCCRKIYVFNPSIHKTFAQKLHFLRTLRAERYDVNITAFPSNRREFNIISFLIGAKRRIAIRYHVGNFETLEFLQTELVETDESVHDVDQNFSLLGPLGINTLLCNGKDISWDVNDEENAYAEELLRKLQLTSHDILIGFHPGCNPSQGNSLKRWPTGNFAILGDKLIEAFDSKILIFGDEGETDLKKDIQLSMKYPSIIPENMPLLKIAALIKRCQLFVTNDSGLMHVATAMGVPTVSLFGPSDPKRNAPYGEGHTVIRADLPCIPCNKYPHYQYGGSYVRCVYNNNHKGHCMQSITVEKVYDTIVQNYASILQPVNV